MIVLLGAMFEWLARFPLTPLALDGAAAAAIGLSLSIGIAIARGVPRRIVPIAFMLATFAAVGLLHWPLLWVVLILGGLSIAIEYLRVRRS